MKEDARFIFVGGCGRSGTTLVQKILTSHSKVIGFEEFGFTSEIMSVFKDMKRKYEGGFLNSYIENEKSLNNNFKLFYESFFQNVDSEISYVSEKTPSNISVLCEILEIFENAIFINVVRDGRDVVSSHLAVKKRYKKAGRFAGFGVLSICKLWNSAIDQYLEAAKDPRVYNIKFEDLITDPENTLRSLFGRIELLVETQQLAPDKIENKNKAHINDIWYTKEMFGKGFDRTSIRKWKKMGPLKKLIVNIVLAKNLNEMGYRVSRPYKKAQVFISYFNISNLRNSYVHKLYVKLRLLFS